MNQRTGRGRVRRTATGTTAKMAGAPPKAPPRSSSDSGSSATATGKPWDMVAFEVAKFFRALTTLTDTCNEAVRKDMDE